jgi:hypothetical protein
MSSTAAFVTRSGCSTASRHVTRRAAIVPDDGEAVEAEGAHHLDLVERHRALRVVGVWFSPSAGVLLSP